jgi:uncharacterized damage-inducible protein DinB
MAAHVFPALSSKRAVTRVRGAAWNKTNIFGCEIFAVEIQPITCVVADSFKENSMKIRMLHVVMFLCVAVLLLAPLSRAEAPAGEYVKHLDALTKLSIQVADAMPADQYGYKPHPDSMTFGELMSHIAATNFQFCAGLADTATPPLPSPSDKPGVVKFLTDSFAYCSKVIPALKEAALTAKHDSPDGRLTGWEVLLAMFVHTAHHRGQAEIYLRNKGIRPPSYMI